MGGGAFFRLKGRQTGLESTEQAEGGVAILPRIPAIAPFLGPNLPQGQEKTRNGCIFVNLC
jgi:hypothetical protein